MTETVESSETIEKIDRLDVLKAMHEDGYGWETTRYIYHLLHGLDNFDRMSFEPCEKVRELHNLGRFILAELRKEGLVEKSDTKRSKWRITEKGVKYLQEKGGKNGG